MSLGEAMMPSGDSMRIEGWCFDINDASDTQVRLLSAIVPTLLRFGKLPICTVIGVSYS